MFIHTYAKGGSNGGSTAKNAKASGTANTGGSTKPDKMRGKQVIDDVEKFIDDLVVTSAPKNLVLRLKALRICLTVLRENTVEVPLTKFTK